METPIWKKSVIDVNGVINVTAYVNPGAASGPYIEIEQEGSIVNVSPSVARSLAGSIAASASKIEVEMTKPAT